MCIDGYCAEPAPLVMLRALHSVTVHGYVQTFGSLTQIHTL